jgi:hypothetical protein
MTSLENQVCSLELAKQLKKLKVKQESLFYWYFCMLDEKTPNWHIRYTNFGLMPDRYSAFTAAELLDLLPHRITLKENEPYNSFRFRMEKGIWANDKSNNIATIQFSEFYSVNYYCDTTSQQMDWMFTSLTHHISDENPSNSLAKMLIYLIETELYENI